jgi:hypothetical protein
MGQTWSMAEAVTRAQGIYDFSWPPDSDSPVWPYVGGWGDGAVSDFFMRYPSVAAPNVETLPSVSGISIGPSSTVPSVGIYWAEGGINSGKSLSYLVSSGHPLIADVPGGFMIHSGGIADSGDIPPIYAGESSVWSSGNFGYVRPGTPFWYRNAYIPYDGVAAVPFGAALAPVTTLGNGVFIPPRLQLRLHLDGSRPTPTARHPIDMKIAHTLAAPAVEEICGVFPIGGRSRVTVAVSFGILNPVGMTAAFRISGTTPHESSSGGLPRARQPKGDPALANNPRSHHRVDRRHQRSCPRFHPATGVRLSDRQGTGQQRERRLTDVRHR